jgi:hypothetical protein
MTENNLTNTAATIPAPSHTASNQKENAPSAPSLQPAAVAPNAAPPTTYSTDQTLSLKRPKSDETFYTFFIVSKASDKNPAQAAVHKKQRFIVTNMETGETTVVTPLITNDKHYRSQEFACALKQDGILRQSSIGCSKQTMNPPPLPDSMKRVTPSAVQRL